MSCVARGLSLVAGGAVSARSEPAGKLYSCEGRSPDARQRSKAPASAGADWAPAFAGELEIPRAAAADSLRTLRRTSARRRLGGVLGCAGRHRKTTAVGAGADGHPRKRTHPPARASFAKSHPRRGARCTRCAVGDGGGGKMLGPLLCDRRDLGRPARARLHRDPAACGRFGAVGRTVLAGAAGRNREPQRRADALADRERAFAAQRARPARARNSGVGRRAVPRERHAARPLEPRA